MVLKVASGGPLNGPVYYQGTWDANANNPFLQSGIGFTGEYYIVSVAGNTTLDGITNWQVGDWAIFNGATNKWEKIDGGSYGTALNIVNDSTSNYEYNLVLTNSSGGLVDTEYVDNGVLTFNPSTSTLKTPATLIGPSPVGTVPLVISAETSAASNLLPSIGVTNTDWLWIACYDNNNPDFGIYNYSLFADSQNIGFYMSKTNTPYDIGHPVFLVNQYGSAQFGTAAGANSGFGTAGQVLISQGSSSAPIWSTPANGTVLSITSGTGITATPNPITSSGTIALANTAVTAGTYGSNGAVAQVTINAQGQITNAQNVAITIPSGNVTGLGTMATQNANAVVITGGTINSVAHSGGTFASANITSVAATFPNSYLANANVIIGNTTVTLGSTVTTLGNVTLQNVTISSGNGTFTNLSSSNVSITGGTINVQATNIVSTTSSTATFATSSLPLVPAGYIQVDLNGTVVKIPYYAV